MAHKFGDFELDESACSLVLRGQIVTIQPLVLKLLSYLVRHAGRVVPKDELMDALWPGLHVSEASLQRAVSLARTILKSGGLESALRNVPRLGYRFSLDRATLAEIAPAELPNIPAASPVDQARQAAHARNWAEASKRFAEADQVERLGPENLDLWAYTLECQGWLASALPLHARAIEGHMARRVPHKAAQSAARLSKAHLELGHADAAKAWIGRAEELLGTDGPPAIEAYILWMKSRFTVFSGKPDEALALIRRAVELAEASSSTSMRALAITYEGFYHITLGDVATGRARQNQAAATALSSEVDPLTGGLIYCSILWTCRTYTDWSRAVQWSPGFEMWCDMAYAEKTGACRLHNADILASVGKLNEALAEIDFAIQRLTKEGTWELGDAYRIRGDIQAMLGAIEAARSDYQMSISLGWDVEPGLARLQAEAGDVASVLASLDRSLASQSWYGRQRRGWLLANKAQIAASAGLAQVAKAALEDLNISNKAGTIPAIEAMALEAQAELAAQESDLTEAVSLMRSARQLWINIHHEFHAARLHLRLAELMDKAGDGTGARMERAGAQIAAQRIGASRLLSGSLLPSA